MNRTEKTERRPRGVVSRWYTAHAWLLGGALLCLVTAPAFGCEVMFRVFSEAHEKLYCPGGCYHHVAQVLRIVRATGGQEGGRVLYLTSSQGETLKPKEAREVPPEGWAYHVVIEVNGKIYDMDQPSPKPIPVAEYFSGWAGTPLTIRSVPTTEFLHTSPPPPVASLPGGKTGKALEQWKEARQHYEAWAKDSDGASPEQSVTSYLKSLRDR